MGWKKALFFGGAVLVLAACSDSATAPTALRQASVPAAAFKLGLTTTPTTTTTTTLEPTLPPLPVIDPVCTGIVIRTGEEGDTGSSACNTISW